MDLTHTTELIEALSNTDTSQIFIDKKTETYVIYRSADENALKFFSQYLSKNNVFNKLTKDGRLYTSKNASMSELYDKFNNHKLDQENKFILFNKSLSQYNKNNIKKLEKDFTDSKIILSKIAHRYNHLTVLTSIGLVIVIAYLLSLIPFFNFNQHNFQEIILMIILSGVIVFLMSMMSVLLFFKKEQSKIFSVQFVSNLYIKHKINQYKKNDIIYDIMVEAFKCNRYGFSDDMKEIFNMKYIDVHFVIDYINNDYNDEEVIYHFENYINPSRPACFKDIEKFYKAHLNLIQFN